MIRLKRKPYNSNYRLTLYIFFSSIWSEYTWFISYNSNYRLPRFFSTWLRVMRTLLCNKTTYCIFRVPFSIIHHFPYFEVEFISDFTHVIVLRGLKSLGNAIGVHLSVTANIGNRIVEKQDGNLITRSMYFRGKSMIDRQY